MIGGGATLLALGLLPRPLLYISGALVVVILSALGQRQCTVMSLRTDLTAATTARAAAETAVGQCKLREDALGEANLRLARSVTAQNDALAQLAADQQAAHQAGAAAQRASERAAGEDRAKADWLAGFVGREQSCVQALDVVRKGLR